MAFIIFWLIIFIIVFDFLSDQFLAYLNNTYRSKPLPEMAKGIYDALEYERSQNYEKDTSRFGFVSALFSTLLLLVFIFAGGFPFLDNFVRSFTNHPVIMALMFFGILGFASSLIGIPFSWYRTFVIEERYGFNKTTYKTFLTDILKSWLLSLLIGVPLLAFVVWIFDDVSAYMWLWAWLGISLFMLGFNYLYSTLIVPLFNKQTPLEEGPLKESIEEFALKTGFKLSGIFVIDGSKRSSKANAYFAGFGSKKRIVLFDTLINKLNNDEIVAVLAHEIGHYKKKHIIKNIILSVISLGLMLFLLSSFIRYPAFSYALGVQEASFHVGAVSFSIIYGFISSFFGIFLNKYSRYNEYEADAYAVKHTSKASLETALVKLARANLSNLQPHPWYVFVYYSHPPLLKRIAHIRSL